MMISTYLHLGPAARWRAEQVEARLTEGERENYLSPQQRLASEVALASR